MPRLISIRVGSLSTDRSGLQWGVDKPNESTTGVLPGITRSSTTGNQTLSSASAETFDNVDFFGQVLVTGTGTKTFNNCWFWDNVSPSTSTHGLLQGTGNNHGQIIANDCTFVPTTPLYSQNGYLGHHATLTRCYFANTVDGIGIYNTNIGQTTSDTGMLVDMCMIDKLYWDVNDPNQVDGSHTDGIQLQGGSNTIIRGTYIKAFHDKTISTSPYTRRADDTTLARATSCIMVTPNVGAITSMQVLSNWFEGAEQQINATAAGNASSFVGTFTNNQHKRPTYFTDHALDFATGSTRTLSGNVWDDGSAATVRDI